jgi:hypothetical protein
MEPKDNINGLIELVKVRVDKYKQTRELEFKVNIALWTLIVLIGRFCQDKVSMDTVTDWVFFIVLTLVIVLGHFFFWVKPISGSLARDSAKVLELQNEIENMISQQSEKPERDEQQTRKEYMKWNFFLAGITLILMVLLGVFFSL